MKLKPIRFVCELMEGKPENEIEEAEERLRRYTMLVKRIAERLEDEEALGKVLQKESTEDVDLEVELVDGEIVFSEVCTRRKSRRIES